VANSLSNIEKKKKNSPKYQQFMKQLKDYARKINLEESFIEGIRDDFYL